MKIEKSVNELLGLHNVLNEVSKRKVPFSIALAKNIKVLKPLLEKFEEDKQAFIEDHALLNEEGTVLGKLKPVEVPDGEEAPPAERIENPQTFQDIDWKEENGLEIVLDKLNKMGSELTEVIIYPVDVDREYYDSQMRTKLKIRDFVDREIEASMVLYLDTMGFFKNLYTEDEDELESKK